MTGANMSIRRAVLMLVATLAGSSCGGKTDNPAGALSQGGALGTGGAITTGGVMVWAGAASTGGRSATGGAQTTGGAYITGGTRPAGGVASIGGTGLGGNWSQVGGHSSVGGLTSIGVVETCVQWTCEQICAAAVPGGAPRCSGSQDAVNYTCACPQPDGCTGAILCYCFCD